MVSIFFSFLTHTHSLIYKITWTQFLRWSYKANVANNTVGRYTLYGFLQRDKSITNPSVCDRFVVFFGF